MQSKKASIDLSSNFPNLKLSPLPECLTKLGHKTLVMGILNVTPDSFSDGGLFADIDNAVKHAQRMIDDGADIIDIGGESTRPGAEQISADDEIKRVIPIIKKLKEIKNICISIDTYKSAVAEEAINVGAEIINDVSALSDRYMASAAGKSGVPIILMHKKGTPKDMQISPHYDSLINDIKSYLKDRIQFAIESGISSDRIIIDPGIGFGKTIEHNLEIIRRLNEFRSLNKPILIGTSRKSFIGKILNVDSTNDRIEGTSATIAISIANGADIIRVHDVKEMVKVARMADAIIRGNKC